MHSMLQSTILLSTSGEKVIATAITAAWRKYLPDFYILPIRDVRTILTRDDVTSTRNSLSHTKGLSSSFNSYTVHKLATYLKDLAVMGIDKCTSQCPVLCPHLFEGCFDAAFPVTIDAIHFTPMPTSYCYFKGCEAGI